MTTKVPGHINDLTNKKQAIDGICLHCFRRQLARIDTTQSHFGGAIAFCACRFDAPVIDRIGEGFEFFIWELGEATDESANA